MYTAREGITEIVENGVVRKASSDSGSATVTSEVDFLSIDVEKYLHLGLGVRNTGAGTATCTVLGYVVSSIADTLDSFSIAGGEEHVTIADVSGYSKVVVHVVPNGEVNLEYEWVRKA